MVYHYADRGVHIHLALFCIKNGYLGDGFFLIEDWLYVVDHLTRAVSVHITFGLRAIHNDTQPVVLKQEVL